MSEAGLSQEDIELIAQALLNFGVAVEMDIPKITGSWLRALVRDEWVPFDERDIHALEAVFGEPLCLIDCVVPYALPFSLAVQRLPNHEWKCAVREDRTVLGRDDFARQYLQERTLSKCIGHWNREGFHL